MSNFQPLEVVDRGSETQLQVAESLNQLAQKVPNPHRNLIGLHINPYNAKIFCINHED